MLQSIPSRTLIAVTDDMQTFWGVVALIVFCQRLSNSKMKSHPGCFGFMGTFSFVSMMSRMMVGEGFGSGFMFTFITAFDNTHWLTTLIRLRHFSVLMTPQNFHDTITTPEVPKFLSMTINPQYLSDAKCTFSQRLELQRKAAVDFSRKYLLDWRKEACPEPIQKKQECVSTLETFFRTGSKKIR